jgi:Uma2 family endonuclease
MTLLEPPIQKARSTPDDVLALEDQGLYELVDGKLVEKMMSSVATETAGLVTGHLFVHTYSKRLGKIYPEQSFQCFSIPPDQVRRPDIAFVTAERATAVEPEGHISVVPDIAIEIVSPNDKIYELDEKIEEYRSAGVKLIWVVNPNSRKVTIYRPDHTVTELLQDDILKGESVLPDFAVPVRELFPAPAMAR